MLPPVGLLEERGHRADDVPALRFALLLDLLDAARSGAATAELLARIAELDRVIAEASPPPELGVD